MTRRNSKKNGIKTEVKKYSSAVCFLKILFILSAFTASRCSQLPEKQVESENTDPFCLNINNREQWDLIAKTQVGKSFIAKTEELLSKRCEYNDIEQLYLDFKHTGSRESYDKPYYQREKLLGALAFAECIENKGRFIPALKKVVNEICSERTWIRPCHDPDLGNFYGERVDIDISSARRGADLSMVKMVMQEKFSKEMKMLINEKVKDRIILPFNTVLQSKG